MPKDETPKKIVIVGDESGFDNWPTEKQKDFFKTLALGVHRYGGGDRTGICQVIDVDHQ